jgi:hypothetical protein
MGLCGRIFWGKMRIAVLHGWGTEDHFDLSRVSILRVLEPLLRAHTVTWVLGKHPSPAAISDASESDLLLLTGLSGLVDLPDWELPGYWNDVAALPYAVTDFALPFSEDGKSRVRLNEDHPFLWLLERASSVGVADSDTLTYLSTVTNPDNLTQLGFPESFVDEIPVEDPAIRSVLVPGENPLCGGFIAEAEKSVNWVFVLESRNDFERGVPPGIRSHHHPRFPQWHLRALQSARSCISFRLSSAIVAHSRGIPSLLVTAKEEWIRIAKSLNLPCLDSRGLQSSKEAWDRAGSLISAERDRSDTPKPTPSYAHFVGKLLGRFDDRRGLSLVMESEEYPLDVCSVSDAQYFPFFMALATNLREVCREGVSLHLLALDDETAKKAKNLPEAIRPTVWRLEQLWTEEELRVISERDTADIAYASKSRLLRTVLSRVGRAAFYFDLDIYFFRSPAHLADLLREKQVLLFPQSCDELRLLRWYGAFNAGMIGVSPGAERFLDWWASLCLHEYENDVRKGYFVDQGFLDLAPVYFPEVSVYRGHDENIACWNLTTHEVSRSRRNPFTLMLRDENTLGSYHTVNPDRQNFFELKHGYDQLFGAFPSTPGNSAPLEWNTLLFQRHYWLALKQ